MTDFGKRRGDMQKSVYDTDDDGVVDGSEATASHASKHQNGGSDEISVAGLSGVLAGEQDAGKIKGVTVDDTDKVDGKVLQYNSTSGNLEYETPTGGGDSYNDRGDPAAYDFQFSDLTADGSQHNLDLSSIIPEGTKAVELFVIVNTGAAGRHIWFKKKGNTNNRNIIRVTAQVADVINALREWVPVSSDRQVTYQITNGYIGIIDIVLTAYIT